MSGGVLVAALTRSETTGTHAVRRPRPPVRRVALTSPALTLLTVCGASAKVLLPQLFDPSAPDSCPLCASILRQASRQQP